MAFNTTASGLQYEDTVVGEGAEAKAGQSVTVHYTSWLYNNGVQGAKFDSSKDRNDPFVFPWAPAWSSRAGTKACRA
jgi:FKBP-type peptidyl-prolyl cis-trans isomerase FkpA